MTKLHNPVDPLRYSFIVVGAGSSGCVIANRLSEDPAVEVLLIEAGGTDKSPVIFAPAATDLYALGRPTYDWCYKAEPDSSRNGRADLWPRGKVLGGSSSINGTIYVRGHPKDFDAWAEGGAPGWSYRDVLPYFRRSEDNDLGPSDAHGTGGMLSVQRLRYVHPLTHCFVSAAQGIGLPHNPDLNGVTQDGVGILQATQRRGWRHSTAQAYLRPAIRRRNLTLLTRAQVTKVIFKGMHAVGVEFYRHGVLRTALASREVVLSAGAIGSPHILLLSGIGPASQLADHGVTVVRESADVGLNLQEHPGAWLTFHMRVPTLNNEMGFCKQIIHGLNWLLFGRGPATTAGAQAIAFLRSGNAPLQPDIQLHFTPVGYSFSGTHVRLNDEPTVSVLVNVCRPLSRGRLMLKSSDPFSPPTIDMRLLDHSSDIQILMSGCRMVRDIMAKPPIRDLVLHEMAPGKGVHDDSDWDRYLRETALPCYHPVGTCRMGTDPGAVLDPELRVRGISGLRVADASVMPTIPSGNTNAAAIMIGEKASDLIRMRHKLPHTMN
jgi:choline dehydrogenase